MQFIKQHKLPFIIAAALLVAALVLFLVLRDGGSSAGGVYVQSVRDLSGGIGSVHQFSGVAESQKTEKIARDAQKTVKEIHGAPGDSVKKGDKLFSYDTELMQLDVQQAQLEIESMQNTINTANSQIAQYQRERQSVSGTERMSYDAQIQQLQAEVNSNTYQLKTKQADLDRLKQGLENSDVLAPADGTIDKVGTIEEALDAENTMVTLRNGGDLRIKGSVSEQNVMSIAVGDPVIVRSRVDKDVTWSGTIDTIDTGSAQQSEEEGMYMEGGSNDRASFYSFYVNLEDDKDIIMGQHVIIEPDFGQGAAKQGLWLPAGFVVDPEGEAYVWMANARMKLEKQPVTIGEYDPDLDMFQITEGLDNDSLIAWPDENCVPGAKATTELVWDEEGMDEEFYGSMDEEFSGEMPADEEFSEAPAEDGEVFGSMEEGDAVAEPAG
jgi:HlyD family secretion protein